MLENLPPFNIDLLLLIGNDSVKNLKQIRLMDIMSGMTKNFHPEGLYSTEIFGKVGDARRSKNFGYIDLHIPIFHPVYFKTICDLKELYGFIMAGKEYAIFDHQVKDFIKSDPIKGETGYKFFLDHFGTLKFAERDSSKRDFKIKLIEKFRKNPMMDKLPVLPAGLRDYTIDENGKPTEDEINNLYRKVIGISNVIENVSVSSNEEYLNNMRYNLQLGINQIYDYIINIIEGKGKLIQGKWAARNIDNSTRNVITPYIQKIKDRKDPQFVSSSQHVIGLYQFLRAIFPKSVQLVRDGYLSKVFTGPSAPANVIDKKTLKSVSANIDPSFHDEWMTTDGLEKQFHKFKVRDLRHEPIIVGQYYLGLMYNGLDKNGSPNGYRFLTGIEEYKDQFPKGVEEADIHPITYAELFYLSVFQIAPSTPGTITRYPIAGYGSIYPSYNYLKSTVTGLVKHEIDDNWEITSTLAPEYPKMDDHFFDSLSPCSSHLARLGADGSHVSLQCHMTSNVLLVSNN